MRSQAEPGNEKCGTILSRFSFLRQPLDSGLRNFLFAGVSKTVIVEWTKLVKVVGRVIFGTIN